MMSLFRSSECLDSAPRPSVGHVRLEHDLPPPRAVGVAFLGVAILVSAWGMGAAPAPAIIDGEILAVSPVGTEGEDIGLSW